jgi:hypothetical protein
MERFDDNLNSQFMFYNFLANDSRIAVINNILGVDYNVIHFLNNHNFDINYYCIGYRYIDSVCYLVTSSTTKRKNNGFRLIEVLKDELNDDNKIVELNDSVTIFYGDVCIKISNVVDNIADINYIVNRFELLVNVHDEDDELDGQFIEYDDDDNEIYSLLTEYDVNSNYNRNINETLITKAKMNEYSDFSLFRNLKFLHLTFLFENKMRRLTWPESIEEMILDGANVDVLKHNDLPQSLKKFTFDPPYCNCRKISKGVLPESLEILTFGHMFNSEINVGVLPQFLKILTFGSTFNKPIKRNVLPNSIITLTFGELYNYEFDRGVLPKFLDTLKMGYWYSQPFKKDVLPMYLKTLIFCGFYSKIGASILPDSLERLDIRTDYSDVVCNKKIVVTYT